jgi:hypothetical protein
MASFQEELEQLINRHSKENGSNTPDFILASYLRTALANFDDTVKAREKWYGREQVSAESQELPRRDWISELTDIPPEGGTE